MVVFSSDLHLGHNNIHKYRCDRFVSQEEHDTYILDKIASLNKRDTLKILGDFIFDSPKYKFYIEQLHKMSCRIQIIMGNHDSLLLYKESKFEIQLPLYSYKNMWISHCPIHPNELRGRIGNIHGHMHKESLDDPQYFNVNLDVQNYEFVPLDLIRDTYRDQK